MSNVDNLDDCEEKKRSFGSFGEGLLCAVLRTVVVNCPKRAVDFVRIRSFLIKMHLSLISYEFLICDVHRQLLWWNIVVGNFRSKQTKLLTIALLLTNCWWHNKHVSGPDVGMSNAKVCCPSSVAFVVGIVLSFFNSFGFFVVLQLFSQWWDLFGDFHFHYNCALWNFHRHTGGLCHGQGRPHAHLWDSRILQLPKTRWKMHFMSKRGNQRCIHQLTSLVRQQSHPPPSVPWRRLVANPCSCCGRQAQWWFAIGWCKSFEGTANKKEDWQCRQWRQPATSLRKSLWWSCLHSHSKRRLAWA